MTQGQLLLKECGAEATHSMKGDDDVAADTLSPSDSNFAIDSEDSDAEKRNAMPAFPIEHKTKKKFFPLFPPSIEKHQLKDELSEIEIHAPIELQQHVAAWCHKCSAHLG